MPFPHILENVWVRLLSTAGDETVWEGVGPSHTAHGGQNCGERPYFVVRKTQTVMDHSISDKNMQISRKDYEQATALTYRKINRYVNALCFLAPPLGIWLTGRLKALKRFTANIADICFLTCHSFRSFNEHFPAAEPERKKLRSNREGCLIKSFTVQDHHLSMEIDWELYFLKPNKKKLKKMLVFS